MASRHRVASPYEAPEAAPSADDQAKVRVELIAAIGAAMAIRDLSQVQASKLLRTDQPTLSKVLRGRTESVSLDKLVSWLLTLGRSVEIRVGPTRQRDGRLKAVVDERVDVAS